MKKLIVALIVLLALPTSITLASKGGNKPDNNSVDLESRVQNLEDRLQNSDLDIDGFTPAEGDCNDADASINPDVYEILGDNIDNNCDGLIDDCESAQEFCDGIDNNCDGQVDEGFDLGSSCSVGIGECRSTGVTVCSADGLRTECDATPGSPRAEVCDGRDNDCNGSVDENIADVPTNNCCSWNQESYDCNCTTYLGTTYCETCYRSVCTKNYTGRCIGGIMQNVCY